MSKHTPGPWVIGPKLHGFDFSIVNPSGDAELGNWLVAGARWQGNARLISAAPELLEAIRYVIRYSDRISPGDIGRLAEIIAKAEGRT